MRRNQYFSFLAEAVQRLVNLLGPRKRVTHKRSPQGVNIMDSRRNIFSHPQNFIVGKPSVHFRWCFGTWCILEHHVDPIDTVFLKSACYC